MAKAFTVASWNVEHFKGRSKRTGRVLEFLAAQDPDVFALYEVEGEEVYADLMSILPGYSFHITEGPQTQEILVGVRPSMTAFFTQKVEFKSGQESLRPGALLSLRIDGADYTILFLHLKSLPSPKGFGLRDDMLERARKFRTVLDKAAAASGHAEANYIFLGDLNTMGMDYPYDRAIDAPTELRRLDGLISYNRMRRLSKNSLATWWNGPDSSYDPSDLDHVVVSKQLSLKPFPGKTIYLPSGAIQTGRAEVDVRGWPELSSPAAQKKWIGEHSDHALLFFQVEKA